jgi:hypothetical protein
LLVAALAALKPVAVVALVVTARQQVSACPAP